MPIHSTHLSYCPISQRKANKSLINGLYHNTIYRGRAEVATNLCYWPNSTQEIIAICTKYWTNYGSKEHTWLLCVSSLGRENLSSVIGPRTSVKQHFSTLLISSFNLYMFRANYGKEHSWFLCVSSLGRENLSRVIGPWTSVKQTS